MWRKFLNFLLRKKETRRFVTAEWELVPYAFNVDYLQKVDIEPLLTHVRRKCKPPL